MTLRRRVILILSSALILAVGLVYAASRFVLIEDLNEIEETEARKNVERVLSYLDLTISDLGAMALNWAAWDDTYNFIETGDEQYIESNLVIDSFLHLRLNLMLFANVSGETVFSKTVDLDKEEVVPISPSLQKYLSDNRSLLEQPGTEGSKSGIILLDEGPMLIASWPILTSEKKGPARGTLIFGRYLNVTEINRMAHAASLRMYIQPVRDLNSYSDLADALVPLLAGGVPIFTKLLNTEYIAGYALLRDIYGNPALVLRVDASRDIYRQGQVSVAYYILVVLAIGLLTIGVSFLILEKQLLSRLTRMVREAIQVTKIGDPTTRLSVVGSDEIALVSQTVNSMLAVLEESAQDLKKGYEQEKELRQNLETEINKRIEFTRALVHELKTPITPVLAASELLLEEIKEERLMRLVQSIDRGASNLNQRIDELLDLARGETDMLQLNLDSIDPIPLLREIGHEMIPVALSKGQSLTVELPSSTLAVSADRERLRQVVQNLLDNAFKYTPDGGSITLRAREDGANLVVEVQDTGLGISEEDKRRLFDPYYRVESDKERLSGLGLGLALSKKFVELHGGRIWVKSRKGEGSTFGFSLPLEAGQAGRGKELNQEGNHESYNSRGQR